MHKFQTIAKTARPFAVVYAYATGSSEQGDVASTHKSHALAEKAAFRSKYNTFLKIVDTRDYA